MALPASASLPQRRLRTLIIAVLVVVCALQLRLMHLQAVLGDEYLERARRHVLSVDMLQPRRGEIRSADDRLLATTADAWNLVFSYRRCYFSGANGESPFAEDVRALSQEELALALDQMSVAQGLIARFGVSADDLSAILRERHRLALERLAHIEACRAWRAGADLQGNRDALARAIYDPERLDLAAASISDPDARDAALDRAEHERQEQDECRARASSADRAAFHHITRLKRQFKLFTYEPVVLARSLPRDLVLAIEAHRDRLDAVSPSPHGMRRYPQGALATHVIGLAEHLNRDLSAPENALFASIFDKRRGAGFVPEEVRRVLGEEELERCERRYLFHDELAGVTGLERALDDRLRGGWGVRVAEKDVRGRVQRELAVIAPRPGDSVRLTIDTRLQEAALSALADRKGAAVLLDVDTGAVLCMVSSPSYDPNLLCGTRTQEIVDGIYRHPDQPMWDRAGKGRYAPGSTFKVVSAVALLESGALNASSRLSCTGSVSAGERTLHCSHRHGHGPGWETLDTTMALEASCNCFFYQAARLMGHAELAKWARAFGFAADSGLELPGMRMGFVPDEAHEPLGETMQLAIGQSRLLATPVQVARMMAVIANGGRLVSVHVIAAPEAPAPKRLGIAPSTLAVVRAGMERVVTGSHGTARHPALQRLAVAGKTGTAEVLITDPDGASRKGKHAWFAGYAPREKPRVAFAVLVEDSASSGGDDAAPRAAKILDAWSRISAASSDDSRPLGR